MRAMKWIGLTVLVFCTGCAGLGKYARDRGNDFLDCFQAFAGYGYGADVHVRATQFVTLGAGWAYYGQSGLNGRQFVNTGVYHIGPPFTTLWGVFSLALAPFGPEEGWLSRHALLKGGAMSLAMDSMGRGTHNYDIAGEFPGSQPGPEDSAQSILGINLVALGLSNGEAKPPRLLDAFNAEFGGTAIVPSLRLGFSPGQFADFLLGFFGLDIAGDDATVSGAAAQTGPAAVIPIGDKSMYVLPCEILWSHDGEEVFYNAFEAPEIRAANVSTQAIRVVARGSRQIWDPKLTLSHDGSLLYYRDGKESDQDRSLYRVGVKGQGQELIATPVGSFALSADGARLVFSSCEHPFGHLSVLDTASGKRKPAADLSTHGGPPRFVIEPNEFVLSPNGQEVLWGVEGLYGGGDFARSLCVVSLDTGATRQVEYDKRWERAGARTLRVRWDPEGIKCCAFAEGDAPWFGVRNITTNATVWRAELGRWGLAPHTGPMNLTWSAEGTKLAWWIYGRPGLDREYVACVADLRSGRARRLGQGSGVVRHAAISRDGKRIAYLVDHHPPSGERSGLPSRLEIHVWDVPQRRRGAADVTCSVHKPRAADRPAAWRAQ